MYRYKLGPLSNFSKMCFHLQIKCIPILQKKLYGILLIFLSDKYDCLIYDFRDLNLSFCSPYTQNADAIYLVKSRLKAFYVTYAKLIDLISWLACLCAGFSSELIIYFSSVWCGFCHFYVNRTW